jgi:glycosyltransferase involved in cell wall biosynthesis
MRLTYLSASGQLGGAENALLDVIAAVRQAKPSWPMQVVIAADGPLAARVSAIGAEPAILPFPESVARIGEHAAAGANGGYARLAAQLGLAAAPVAGYTRQLAQTVSAFGPDLVHSNGLKFHVLGAMARLDAPLVWHLHDYIGGRRATSTLLRWNRTRCAAIVANSRSVADDVRRVVGGDVPVVAVHNAVDLSRFSPDGDQQDLDRLAALPPAPAGTVRVGLVATFARWKGHETFMRAIAELADTPVRAYVIGDALYQTEGSQYSRDELARLATADRLGDRIGFTGFVEPIDDVYRALDVVVHASTAPEPFGLVIAEAMACARAVVVSNAGGAAEVVTPGVDALTHAPGDVAELASAIRALIFDAAKRAALGRAARQTALHAFDRARLARELLTVYESAAAVRA